MQGPAELAVAISEAFRTTAIEADQEYTQHCADRILEELGNIVKGLTIGETQWVMSTAFAAATVQNARKFYDTMPNETAVPEAELVEGAWCVASLKIMGESLDMSLDKSRALDAKKSVEAILGGN